MAKPHFLVLAGDGINCEQETQMAFRLAEAQATIVHINDLLENPQQLLEYQGLALPGGFSFGDELGSGQLLALKIQQCLKEEFLSFVAARKPIIGICNGFQVLAKLGVFTPHYTQKNVKALTLAENTQGSFINQWASLDVDTQSVCKWTRFKEPIPTLELPIRHKEGRILLQRKELFEQLQSQGQIPLTYQEDINGSYRRIAGVCDPTGLILGLMPHPEAALFQNLMPTTTNKADMSKGPGMKLFLSIVDYVNQS